MNYPDGFTQREHDRQFAGRDDSPMPHEETCPLCGSPIVKDSDRNMWFLLEDYEESGGFEYLNAVIQMDAFKTDMGWICSVDCYNDHGFAAYAPIKKRPFIVHRREA